MATVPFPGTWIPDAQFTGNSGYVFDSNGAIWLVANSTSSGSIIFSSTNNGGAFTQVVAVPNVGSAGLSFDPAITIDANNVLHFVGQVAVSGAVKLQKFSYDTVGGTLAGPFTIDTGGIIGSDYDIVALSNGHCYIVCGLVTLSTETVSGFEIDSGGNVIFTDSIVNQAIGAGNRYGAISLVTPDGVSVEIYLCAIPKAFNYAASTAQLTVSIRNGSDTIAAPTTLTSFSAMYLTDRLTVIPDGTSRYLSESYFSQQGAALIGNTLLGYLPGGGAWSFQAFPGTVAHSLLEPVLSVSSAGVVLAVINANLASFADGATISLFDVTTTGWVLTPRTDFPYVGLENWLRGTKSIIPTAITWGFVGQRAADGVARFYTGALVPPVAEIMPATATGTLGVPFVFDASSSFDINLHPLQFSWSLTDPTDTALLVPNGDQASVTLPLSAGPAAETLTVTVSVIAVDVNGNSLGSPVTASASLNYPQIAAPTIATPSTINASRNSQVIITPTVTVSQFRPATYEWAQTGGTTIEILSLTNQQNLTIQTNGASVLGETLSFTLIVSDGVNSAVEQVFQVAVAARIATGETTVLAHALWPGNISDRNTPAQWPIPTAGTVVTQFVNAKRAPVAIYTNGIPAFIQGGVYALISPLSVTIACNGSTWHALPPVPTETIIDAIHSFHDETIMLTSGGKLLKLIPSSPPVDTDNAQGTILLSNFTTQSFAALTAMPPFGGTRVLVLTGPGGVLFVEVDTFFNVMDTFSLGAGTNNLYGANSVQWIRLADVENLHTGSVLVGTADNNGNTFETEFSLATRMVLGVLDSTHLKNKVVTTGELLFEAVDSYSGVPLAPVLVGVASSVLGITLNWTQTRQDLVTGYAITVETGGGLVQTNTVGAGVIVSTTITGLTPGKTYTFQVIATSDDGNSAPSNSLSINI